MGALLYSFRRCPFAMRARMALVVSGLEYEHREVLLRDKPASMLTYSPKGTVPVFVCEDGKVLDESQDIMLFALEQNDPENWLDCDLETAHALSETITGPFKFHLDRYKYASRYDKSATRKTVDLDHRNSACQILKNFEHILSRQDYLLGKRATLADYAVFPFIRQFAHVEPDWWHKPQFPNLQTWLSGLMSSPLFMKIMTKHPIWREGE